MNKRPKPGSGWDGLNNRLWVSAAMRAAKKQIGGENGTVGNGGTVEDRKAAFYAAIVDGVRISGEHPSSGRPFDVGQPGILEHVLHEQTSSRVLPKEENSCNRLEGKTHDHTKRNCGSIQKRAALKNTYYQPGQA
jgi:hypothetical protein